MDKKANKNKWLVVAAGVLATSLTACGHANDGMDDSSSPAASTAQESTPANSVTSELTSPSEMRKGDILIANFDSAGHAVLSFDGVESGAEFNLIVGTSATSSGSYSMQLSNNLSEGEPEMTPDVSTAEGESDIQENLDQTLRGREFDLVSKAPISSKFFKASQSAAPSKNLSEGDVESFRVLGSISSGTQYVEISAIDECLGSHVAFYVDQEVSASELSKADVQKLCSQFDAMAGTEQSLFGSLSDINGDGRVQVVMTPQVNRLGGLGGGIITGFFNASDLYPRSNSNPVSNQREVLFVMVPDPTGHYGVQISKDFSFSNLLPAVLPHELQHAISYNQHVFVNKGQPEEPWLNEAMSHLAEDLMGLNQENASRYAMYLSNPASYSLVTTGQPGLAARGGSYLFMRYLYEQSDDPSGFMSRLLNTSLTGTANVERAFQGRDKSFDQFSEFFLRWNVALLMSNRGLTDDARYIYRSRVRNDATDSWSGVCITCQADDNRGTVLSGESELPYFGFHTPTFAPTTAKVFDISEVPSQLALNASNGSQLFGVLVRVR